MQCLLRALCGPVLLFGVGGGVLCLFRCLGDVGGVFAGPCLVGVLQLGNRRKIGFLRRFES
jgi:hypothetical protein